MTQAEQIRIVREGILRLNTENPGRAFGITVGEADARARNIVMALLGDAAGYMPECWKCGSADTEPADVYRCNGCCEVFNPVAM